jgi:hypothetical protein
MQRLPAFFGGEPKNRQNIHIALAAGYKCLMSLSLIFGNGKENANNLTDNELLLRMRGNHECVYRQCWINIILS